MRSVNVAELKNRLSQYLTFGKAGEEAGTVFGGRRRPGVSPGCRWEAAPPSTAAECKGTLKDPHGQRFGKQSDPSRSR